MEIGKECDYKDCFEPVFTGYDLCLKHSKKEIEDEIKTADPNY